MVIKQDNVISISYKRTHGKQTFNSRNTSEMQTSGSYKNVRFSADAKFSV